MAQDPKYGHEPPTKDDGSYKDVVGQFGFWYLLPDGHTVENVLDGSQYDLENIGSGGSTSDTRTDVSNDGATLVSDVQDINFASLLTASDDGDGTVTVAGTDTHVPISEDGAELVADPTDLNFGSGITAADDGDDTVSVTVADETVRTRQAQVPLTEIADTNTAVGLQMLIPSGKTLRILEMGVTDDTESAPTGLTIEVQDLTNATTIASKNTKHAEGTPIASKSGPVDVQFRVANATGGVANGSGYVLFTME